VRLLSECPDRIGGPALYHSGRDHRGKDDLR